MSPTSYGQPNRRRDTEAPGHSSYDSRDDDYSENESIWLDDGRTDDSGDAYRYGGFGGIPASAAAIAGLEKHTLINTEQEAPRGMGGETAEAPCANCLDDLECGDVLSVMPCSHCFHEPCLDKWRWRSAACALAAAMRCPAKTRCNLLLAMITTLRLRLRYNSYGTGRRRRQQGQASSQNQEEKPSPPSKCEPRHERCCAYDSYGRGWRHLRRQQPRRKRERFQAVQSRILNVPPPTATLYTNAPLPGVPPTHLCVPWLPPHAAGIHLLTYVRHRSSASAASGLRPRTTMRAIVAPAI
uniref:RING-type domain-containing protein n=1 Tax=Setaria viridis TaxID=4556 RepID=A0A4U6TF01_SETVI|nr:LOW QUALITY PROTEIN: hypothetical protein SEVIR_8G031300v2 [Setaria viridis]